MTVIMHLSTSKVISQSTLTSLQGQEGAMCNQAAITTGYSQLTWSRKTRPSTCAAEASIQDFKLGGQPA